MKEFSGRKNIENSFLADLHYKKLYLEKMRSNGNSNLYNRK